MTPKEKAKELLDKYDFVYIQNYTSMFEVKQCAIIAVDEIINNFGLRVDGKTNYTDSATIQFYQEVKKEIEKL